MIHKVFSGRDYGQRRNSIDSIHGIHSGDIYPGPDRWSYPAKSLEVPNVVKYFFIYALLMFAVYYLDQLLIR